MSADRHIIKEGYLKKMPSAGASVLKLPQKRWFVFVLLRQEPRLEYYENRADSTVSAPIKSFRLTNCREVLRPFRRGGGGETSRSFKLVLDDRILELWAPNLEEADSWQSVLNRYMLHHLEGATCKDRANDYAAFSMLYGEVKDTEAGPPAQGDCGSLSTRRKVSSNGSTCEGACGGCGDGASAAAMPAGATANCYDLDGDTFAENEMDSSCHYASRALSFVRHHLTTRGEVASAQILANDQTRIAEGVGLDELDDDIYERLEQGLTKIQDWSLLENLRTKRKQSMNNVYKPNPDPPPYSPTAQPIEVVDFKTRATLRRSLSQPSSSSINRPRQQSVAPLFITPGHRSSVDASSGTCNLSPVVGAVHDLKSEILSPGGLLAKGRVVDLLDSVAYFTTGGTVWVAGWRVRATRLHNMFHIGDQVVAVNNWPVDSAATVVRALHALPPDQLSCFVRLRRMPLAKAFVVRRELEGQNVGLKMDGGTNVVKCVVPGGMADLHGLPPAARSFTEPHKTCPWTLTEVNNRPLNLSYKNGEVQVLLNAYGKDMSLIVQPSDFVKLLRKHIKSVRNYKDYLYS